MNGPKDTSDTDVLLLPFVRSGDDASEVRLSELIAEQTESTIKGIIRSRLRVSLSPTDGSHDNQEALDLVADVQTELLAGLRSLKRDGQRTIGNLRGYVGAVTFNACNQLLRRKYPERLRLKNKLRYLLTHAPEFALWETEQREWLCGLAAWRNTIPEPRARVPISAIRNHQPISRSARGAESRVAFIGLLNSIFHQLQSPALLEDVVTLAAESLGIRDTSGAPALDAGGDNSATQARGEQDVETELVQRAELQHLWSAICGLPLRHRAALLLNLRDKHGGDALALLPLTRVATIEEIANAVAFTPEEFARIWNDLPWDDLTIAKHLGLTRQQVINLRQSARARLARAVNMPRNSAS